LLPSHGQSRNNPFFIQTYVNERASLLRISSPVLLAARASGLSADCGQFRAQRGSGRITSGQIGILSH
jgi:hypothetical protein